MARSLQTLTFKRTWRRGIPGWEDLDLKHLARAVPCGYGTLIRLLIGDTRVHAMLAKVAKILEMEPLDVYERTLISGVKYDREFARRVHEQEELHNIRQRSRWLREMNRRGD